MQTKIFEIRDRGTFIPIIAIRPVGSDYNQQYLLNQAGFGADTDCVLLVDPMGRRKAEYDLYNWPADDRTFRTAHHYLDEHFDELKDGDVIDIEYILKETTKKKRSQRYDKVVNGEYIVAYEGEGDV